MGLMILDYASLASDRVAAVVLAGEIEPVCGNARKKLL